MWARVFRTKTGVTTCNSIIACFKPQRNQKYYASTKNYIDGISLDKNDQTK